MKYYYHLTILLASFLFCISSEIFAAPPDSLTYQSIDQYIQKQMKTYKIPGAAIGIVEDDSAVYLKGYGIADNSDRKVSPKTPFLLGSVTKSFTALGIMQLVEEGKIDLDTPVQKYLPWFRIADVKASSQITVRQLLNQTSGFSTLDGRKKYTDHDMKEDALENYIRSLKGTELIAPPGQKFEYSNINYGILGLIIQKISGMSYESYIQKKIFEPLNMQHSYTSLADAKAGAVSRGYYPFFDIPATFDKPLSRAITPWGGLCSSTEDMTHYIIANLNKGNYLNREILSEQGMVDAHSPGPIISDNFYKSSYGMGWGIYPQYKPNKETYTAISHDGAGPFYHSFVLLVPEKKFGMVLLINLDDPLTESIFSYLGWIIAEIYFGKPPSYPQPAENFIVQHARVIYAGLVILLIIGFFWSLRSLRLHRLSVRKNKHTLKPILLYLIIPLIIDILLSIYILAVLLPQNDFTLHLALVFTPDVGIMLIVILLLTIVWGAIRTFLMLKTLYRKS